MLNLHETLHDDYGICLWTLLAIVVFAIMAIIAIVHIFKQNRRESRFERGLGKQSVNSEEDTGKNENISEQSL